MSASIAVHGAGVAACACVRLLQKQELTPWFHPEANRTGPTLLLNPATLQLLRDVFGTGDEFCFGLHRVHRRVVLWGRAETTELAHYGFAIQESLLLDQLWRTVEAATEQSDRTVFDIYSTARHSCVEVRTFGTRFAASLRVTIKPKASDACWVESVSSGWLFLIPDSQTSGALLVVGGETEELLAQSRLIAAQVNAFEIQSSGISVVPRIAQPLCEPNWLACGSAAMAFDPICGEGVGNAVREAVLACACLRHPNRESTLRDYSPRLMLGFLKHLDICRGFYASGGDAPWWTEQLCQLEQGISWVRQQVTGLAPPQYRLAGFELESMS